MTALPLLLVSLSLAAPDPGAITAPESLLAETPEGQVLQLEDERWLGDGALERLVREAPLPLRQAAVRAAGRIGDAGLLPALGDALGAPAPEVRREAAMALGELGDAAAEPGLEAALADSDPAVRLAAIEALGKLRDPRAEPALLARLLASDASVEEKGAVLLQLWKVRSPESIRRALDFLTAEDPALRRRAAYCVLRARVEDAVPELLQRLSDSDPTVRSIAARALGPTRSPDAVEALVKLVRASRSEEVALGSGAREEHLLEPAPLWQVRVSAIRSLGELKDRRAEPVLIESLGDANANVEAVAIEALGECGSITAVSALEGELGSARPRMRELAVEALAKIEPDAGRRAAERLIADPVWSVRAAAVRAFGRLGDRPALLAASEDADARVVAEALTAYAESRAPDAGDRLLAFLSHRDPVVRSIAIDRLAEPVEGAPDRTPLLLEAWELARKDPILDARLSALTALSSRLDQFTVQKAFFEALKDPEWLVRQKAVELMRLAGKKGEAILAGRVGTGRPGPFYDAVAAWAGEARPRAAIETTRGRIVLDLFPADAPLSVYNFVKLARAGYYEGLAWHRVVPNFVVQTGCPRGDGWGGPGYAVRCEINDRRFVRGAVGMALAGKDTGGSQFFIVHSDQSHLDGGYTVIGRVVEGMSVADAITQGDQVTSISIEGGEDLPAEQAPDGSPLRRWVPRGGAPAAPAGAKKSARTPRPARKEEKGSEPERGEKKEESEKSQAAEPSEERPAAKSRETVRDADSIKREAEELAEREVRERRKAEERAARERRREQERRRNESASGESAVAAAEPATPAAPAEPAPAATPVAASAGAEPQLTASPDSGAKPGKAKKKAARQREKAEREVEAAAAEQAEADRKAAEKQAKAAKEAAAEQAKADRKAAEQQAKADKAAAAEQAKADRKTAEQQAKSDKAAAEKRARAEKEAAKVREKAAREASAEPARSRPDDY